MLLYYSPTFWSQHDEFTNNFDVGIFHLVEMKLSRTKAHFVQENLCGNFWKLMINFLKLHLINSLIAPKCPSQNYTYQFKLVTLVEMGTCRLVRFVLFSQSTGTPHEIQTPRPPIPEPPWIERNGGSIWPWVKTLTEPKPVLQTKNKSPNRIDRSYLPNQPPTPQSWNTQSVWPTLPTNWLPNPPSAKGMYIQNHHQAKNRHYIQK